MSNVLNDDEYLYAPKKIMTDFERYFYNSIKSLKNELNVEIVPQVSLESIVRKKFKNKYINELFKFVDFGVFTKDFKRLLFVIEINDKTHKRPDRVERDKKVKEILSSVGIKIVPFYSYKTNYRDYVKNRVRTNIIDCFNEG